MSASRLADDFLRHGALARLGALGDPLAREALELGALEIETDVLAWEGSSGSVHGHRVVLVMPSAVHERVIVSHAARDALAESIAAALSERPGHSLADLTFEAGASERGPAGGPYRG